MAAVGTLQNGTGFFGDKTSTTISITLASPAVVWVPVVHTNYGGSAAAPSVSSDLDGSFGAEAIAAQYGAANEYRASSFLKALSAGSHVITVGLTGTDTNLYGQCSALPITGLANATVDKSSPNEADSTTPTTGSTGTQTAASGIALVLLGGNGGSAFTGWTNPPSGFTNVRNDPSTTTMPFSMDYKIKSDNSAENASYGTLSTGGYWGAVILTLADYVAPPSAPPFYYRQNRVIAW